jgi:glycosyltransferase involved in cell wall biosynthesis
MLSIVVPLYRSEENLPDLFRELGRIAQEAPGQVELVFVNDGSPDRSAEVVAEHLERLPAPAQLIRLSRNFGAFSAIAAGLKHARGDYFAVIAADLQEPPELTLRFWEELRSGRADVVFGVRENRSDPALSLLASTVFWYWYRRLVNPEIPEGGVDIFGCNRQVRDQICAMKEVETSLVGLLFWVGYRRGFVGYERRERTKGKSAWTFRKKLNYLVNSVFNFTDLPLRLLMSTGLLGIGFSLVAGVTVLWAKLSGKIALPGYTATVLTIVFFGGLTALGLGIVGQYLWLTLQNARQRPLYIVASMERNGRELG